MNVLAEVLSVINVINFNINMDDADDIDEVKVIDSKVQLVRSNCSSSLVIELAKRIYLQANSVSGLHYDGSSWILFRTQIEQNSNTFNTVLENILNEMPTLNLWCTDYKELDDLVDKPISLLCRCGSSLTKDIILSKFCFLPPDSFETSENCFCHCHGDCATVDHSYSVSPSVEKCLYNEFFYGLNSAIFKETVKIDHAIKCVSCSADIGFVKSDQFNIWASEVQWSDGISVLDRTPFDILIMLMKNIERDSICSSVQILLECEKEFLYINIIDSNLTLLLTGDSPLLSCRESNSSSEGKNRLKQDSSCKVKKWPSIKVLFKHKVSRDDEVKSWQKDVNLNNYSCNLSVLHSLHDSLTDSNTCLPPSVRNVGNLKVGYIVK